MPEWAAIMAIYVRQCKIVLERYEKSEDPHQKEYCLELAKLYLKDALNCYDTESKRIRKHNKSC